MELFRQIVEEMDLEIDDYGGFYRQRLRGSQSCERGKYVPGSLLFRSTAPMMCLRRSIKAYGRKLKENRLIDFDDMLLYTWELFKARRDILGAWQKKFQYILIDEFQDINQVQYEIIRMMAAPENNLLLLGDDDQSIYVSEAPVRRSCLDLQRITPNPKRFFWILTTASTPTDCGGSFAGHKNNRERYEKQLKAFHSGGEPIEVKMFNTMAEEYETLIREVYQSHKEDKMPL